MQATAQPLFEIAIEHAYHSAGGCPGLVLSPRGWSDGPLARLRRSAGGGRVLGDPRTGAGRIWRFDLTPNEDAFRTYTTVGAPPGSIVAFAPSDDAARDERSIALVPAIVARRPRRFLERVAAPFVTRRIDILSMRDSRIIGAAAPFAGDDPRRAIDIGAEPDGRFQLVANGTVLLDFHSSDDVGLRAWGVLDLPAPAPPVSRFTLDLAARAMIWRYHIVDGGDARRSVETATLSLEERERSAEPRVSFSFVRREIVAGRAACLFQSDGPLVLSDRPGGRFRLGLKGDGSDRFRRWSEPLPFAGVEQVVGEEGGFVAEVFVYLC